MINYSPRYGNRSPFFKPREVNAPPSVDPLKIPPTRFGRWLTAGWSFRSDANVSIASTHRIAEHSVKFLTLSTLNLHEHRAPGHLSGGCPSSATQCRSQCSSRWGRIRPRDSTNPCPG